MCSSPSSHVRVGIVVPLFGHTAVERNKLKRQLRELARVELLDEEASVDVLIFSGNRTYGRSFLDLQENVRMIQQCIREEGR
jgi:ribonuclease P protein component